MTSSRTAHGREGGPAHARPRASSGRESGSALASPRVRERGARHPAPSGAFNRATFTAHAPLLLPRRWQDHAALRRRLSALESRHRCPHTSPPPPPAATVVPAPPAVDGGGGGGAADGTARAAWPARAAGAMFCWNHTAEVAGACARVVSLRDGARDRAALGVSGGEMCKLDQQVCPSSRGRALRQGQNRFFKSLLHGGNRLF